MIIDNITNCIAFFVILGGIISLVLKGIGKIVEIFPDAIVDWLPDLIIHFLGFLVLCGLIRLLGFVLN